MTLRLLVGKGKAAGCFARDGRWYLCTKVTHLDLSNFGPGGLDGEVRRSEGL